MIKKLSSGKFQVYDHVGKKALSKPLSKIMAIKRLRQVEYFKRFGKS